MLRKILVALFFISSALSAENINIRIYSELKISSVIISPEIGDYYLYADGKEIIDTSKANVFQLTAIGDSIEIKALEKNFGKYANVRFVGAYQGNSFKIKPFANRARLKVFNNDLWINPSNGTLKLINVVNIENYIAGVVESESGLKSTPEYYKLQSILCRTYALGNLRRHEGENYQLCDLVHCQAYKNKTTDADIIKAVAETKGLVIVDSDLNIITAAFHSNCGGQTINSEDVWSLPTTYLKAVKDTFCTNSNHSHWSKSIAIDDWKSYLELKHKYPVDDSLAFSNALNYPQNGREIYFADKGLKIPLKVIRADWQLKSTYFSIEQRPDSIVFKGKGYGHGVGLCQEGAMQMAKIGYSYKDILHFYYRDVHLVDLSALNFFKQE